MNDSPPTLTPAPAPKKRNWLFIGCVGALVLVLLLIGLVIGGGWWFYRRTLDRYTAAAPMTLPKSELSGVADAEWREKLNTVYTAFQQGRAVELELSGPELNATLADSAELKDHLWVEIKDGRLHGKISVPLDDIGLKALRGRWLNGDATLALGTEAGKVSLRVETLMVNGRSLPAQLLEAIRKENLVEDIGQDPEAAPYLQRIDTVGIEGGKLRVRFKP